MLLNIPSLTLQDEWFPENVADTVMYTAGQYGEKDHSFAFMQVINMFGLILFNYKHVGFFFFVMGKIGMMFMRLRGSWEDKSTRKTNK